MSSRIYDSTETLRRFATCCSRCSSETVTSVSCDAKVNNQGTGYDGCDRGDSHAVQEPRPQRPSSRSCWSKGREQTRHSKNGIERPALRNCPSASRRPRRRQEEAHHQGSGGRRRSGDSRPFAEPLLSPRRSSVGAPRTWVTLTRSSVSDQLVEELFASFDDGWFRPPRRW
jgi:hypothetical protein